MYKSCAAISLARHPASDVDSSTKSSDERPGEDASFRAIFCGGSGNIPPSHHR